MNGSNLVIEEGHDNPDPDKDHRPDPDVTFTVRTGNSDLEFRDLSLIDPVPTGRQIVDAAGFGPVEEFLIFAVSHDHQLTEVELDETVDVRGRHIECFLIFRSDRSWRGLINGKRFEWGAETIDGHVLKWLSCIDPTTHGVWLELRDKPDRPIADDDKVSLSSTGVERFWTDVLFHVCIEGTFYQWPRSAITTEEIAVLGGWDVSEGVIEVDQDQNERTLAPGEIIEPGPSISFGKKLRFKRG